MKKEIKLKKIVMQVNDLQNMRLFYEGLFKMHIESETEEKMSFSFYKGGDVVLELIETKPNIPREPYTGLYHFAFLFEKEADMASLVTHLLESGYPLSGAADHLVSHAVYLQDPEGNDIELYADLPRDVWRWENEQVVMDTLPLNLQALVDMSHPWTGFSDDVTIGHLHFYGTDLVKADAFFKDVLMMDRVSELGQHAYFYSINDYHHHLAMNSWKISQPLDDRKMLLGLSKWEIELSPEYFEAVRANLDKLSVPYSEENDIIYVKDTLDIPLKIGVINKHFTI